MFDFLVYELLMITLFCVDNSNGLLISMLEVEVTFSHSGSSFPEFWCAE